MFPSFALVFLIALLYTFKSYPKTIGTPPLPEKLIFISDLQEPCLSIASALTNNASTPVLHQWHLVAELAC